MRAASLVPAAVAAAVRLELDTYDLVVIHIFPRGRGSLVPRSAAAAAAAAVSTSSAAHVVDDGHVVGKVADIVVLLAFRYLAVDLWEGIKSGF